METNRKYNMFHATIITAMMVSPILGLSAEDPTSSSSRDNRIIDEILITAARGREEPIQSAPVAVSAVTADQIEKLQSADITSLSSVVPNLIIDRTPMVPGGPVISIRGFSSRTSDVAAEPGVPVYIDGVYQSIITGSGADTFDLESIEILRGPQGTLLGKNASAGGLLLRRSRPTGELDGKMELEYGSKDLIQVQGLINFPIIENVLAGKIYGMYRNRDGWIKNIENSGKNSGAEQRSTIRGALVYTPIDTFNLYITADYIRDESEQLGFRNVSDSSQLGCVFFNECAPHRDMRRVTSGGLTDKPRWDESNVTANAEWNLGAIQLTSITGYRKYEQKNVTDLDASPHPILEVPSSYTNMKQYSQELRLISSEGGGLDLDGRLNWLLAGYYGYSDADMDLAIVAFGEPQNQFQRYVRDNYAIFGQLDYELIDSLTVSFGARRSWDEVEHDFSLPTPGLERPKLEHRNGKKFNNTSIEAGARYQIDSEKMIYFRYAEGYRGGGFVGHPASLEAAAAGFGPEESKNYEVGAKTDWLNGKLRVNVTLFETKFSDLQQDIVLSGPGNTFIQTISNAADATTKGVELEAVISPVENWTVRSNIGYLDAGYDDYVSIDPVDGKVIDLSGQPIRNAQRWTGSLSTDYWHAFEQSIFNFKSINFHARLTSRSSFQTSSTAHPVGNLGGYTIVDASFTLNAPSYNVTFYINNAFDKNYTVMAENISGLVSWAADNFPRHMGIKVGINF